MSNSKNKNDPTGHGDTLERLGIMAVVCVIALLLTPITILSMVGGYFLYWAWFSKPERRLTRTFCMVVLVFLGFGLIRDIVLYNWFDELAQIWLKYFGNGRRQINIFELRSIMSIWYVYIPTALSPAAAGFFKYKNWDVMKEPYELARQLMLAISPSRSLIMAIDGASKPMLILLASLVTLIFPLFLGKFVFWIFPKSFFAQLFFGMKPFSPGVLIFAITNAYSFLTAGFELSEKQKAETMLTEKGGASSNLPMTPLEIGRFKGRGAKLTLTWKDLNHHIHILGQPGSGKSNLLRNVYQHQIRNGAGMMIVDLKADKDAFHEVVGLCESSNRLGDLQVIDLKKPDVSCGYNPLLRGSASELKDKIIGSMEWSEVYYKKVAERFVLNVMRGLVAIRDQHEAQIPALSDLLEALTRPMALETLAQRVPDNQTSIRSDLRALALELKGKDAFEALSGLRTDLEVLVKSEFGEILSRPDSIDLLGSIQSRKIVYVLLDGQTFGTLALRIGRMLLADLRAASGSIVTTTGREERPRFTVVIDEFSDLVSTAETGQLFTGFLNRCRGSGIGVIVAHQSLGDFTDRQVMKQVLDSTETLFSFVQKDPESAEILSGIAGTKEVWEKTEQVNNDFMFGDSTTGMGTRKRVHEFLYHPNDFKNLNTGEAIYVAKKPSRHGLVVVDYRVLPKVELSIQDEQKINKTPTTMAPLLDLKGQVAKATQRLTAMPSTATEDFNDLV